MEKDNSFVRTNLLLGKEAMDNLKRATVTVAGLGGVGSFAVEALARMGIGHLRIFDFDSVKRSNINRQLFALESSLNMKKIDIARDRILNINPACKVSAADTFIHKETLDELFSEPSTVVIDAIDSLTPKIVLLEALYKSGVPAVSSMGAAVKVDPFSIRIGDISETNSCPLARFIRKRLKKKGIETGIKCIYSVEVPPKEFLETPLDEAEINEEVEFKRGRNRKALPSLSYIPAMFGLLAAHAAIKSILNWKDGCNINSLKKPI